MKIKKENKEEEKGKKKKTSRQIKPFFYILYKMFFIYLIFVNTTHFPFLTEKI